jgi:putative ABC transport system permease protein
MRDVAVEPKESSRLRVAAGLLVTGAGGALLAVGLFAGGGVPPVAVGVPLTFIGVAVLGPVLARPFARFAGAPLPRLKGMTGTLARANATRNPKRTSATAAALMIGVGLVGFITVFATSAKASIDHMIDTAFRADYVLDSGMFGMGGLPPEMAQRLEDVPEVGNVTSVRLTMAQVAGKSQGLAAFDPEGIGQVFDLDVTKGDLAALDAQAIAVSSDVADKNGWTIGTSVPVRFAATGDQTLTVKAIYGARELAGDYLIGFAAYDANVPDRFDYQVYVDRAPGVSAAQARAAIEKVTDAYPSAKLQDQTQFKAARAAQVNQLLGLIYALLGLAVLIALLGIANTLALSIFERTHELGLLRAVGMTRAQLRSTIRWESVLIALFGTGLGLVIGTAFGWALVRALHDRGITELRVPAGQLAFIALIAALCGILAAVLPARRAARLDVLAAIATA